MLEVQPAGEVTFVGATDIKSLPGTQEYQKVPIVEFPVLFKVIE